MLMTSFLEVISSTKLLNLIWDFSLICISQLFRYGFFIFLKKFRVCWDLPSRWNHQDLIFLKSGGNYLIFSALFNANVGNNGAAVCGHSFKTLSKCFFRCWWRMEEQFLRERSVHHQEKQSRFTITQLVIFLDHNAFIASHYSQTKSLRNIFTSL